MSDIDPIEFGKLCENVKNTHTLVKDMDTKMDKHHDRISDLENHNVNVKKTVKTGVAITGSVSGFLAWLFS